jgi:D-sedoheptulose 7-phosphate isomerase
MKINSETSKMENTIVLDELITRFPVLSGLRSAIEQAADCLIGCYSAGNKLLICGNGGSSSDSDHIAGELLKGFENSRPLTAHMKDNLVRVSPENGPLIADKLQAGLPAISLSAHSGLVTAIVNDTDATLIYAQQVIAYGRPGDVLMGLSTSGNAKNVVNAAVTARAAGLTVIGMTGETGGRLRSFSDILINVPEKRTAYVQELHLPVYHALCLIVENHFFGTK